MLTDSARNVPCADRARRGWARPPKTLTLGRALLHHAHFAGHPAARRRPPRPSGAARRRMRPLHRARSGDLQVRRRGGVGTQGDPLPTPARCWSWSQDHPSGQLPQDRVATGIPRRDDVGDGLVAGGSTAGGPHPGRGALAAARCPPAASGPGTAGPGRHAGRAGPLRCSAWLAPAQLRHQPRPSYPRSWACRHSRRAAAATASCCSLWRARLRTVSSSSGVVGGAAAGWSGVWAGCSRV